MRRIPAYRAPFVVAGEGAARLGANNMTESDTAKQ